MTRLVLCVLVILVAGASADPLPKPVVQKPADAVHLQHQWDLMQLYLHIHEPNHNQAQIKLAESWDIEKNIEHFSNVTAVKLYVDLLEFGLLPRGVPFSILEPAHRFEALTLFNILHSAKSYDVFYNAAVHFRDVVNEGLYVYVLSVAILHRPDTQGIVVPPIYEVLPSFFHNAEILMTAQRINIHGVDMIKHYPSTYLWENNVVIRWNETVWPYFSVENSVAYYTHDYALNTFYYNYYLMNPLWLGGDVVPLAKDRRGEWFWFILKQIVSRYYMERLSNGMSEIPELNLDVVMEGYNPALLHMNGVPLPVRPNYFHLDQPGLTDVLLEVMNLERRIHDAIDSGYVINSVGEHISIRSPESIDILGNIIEANVDSINLKYYKDFISIWKSILGNSAGHEHHVYKNQIPLVVPSALENFETSLRDPAFFIIAKRVLQLFRLWHEHLPLYKPEELALPSVVIQNVEVDKLVTYFELANLNVTNYLYMNEMERNVVADSVSVLVQRPQLNHKTANFRIHVKSDVAQTVLVKLFLAPKYDSHGYEIPLHLNTQNFFQLDMFTYDLSPGETVIKRNPADNPFLISDWPTMSTTLWNTQNALHGSGQVIIDPFQGIQGFPNRLLFPKGRAGGMPFLLLVYISEYHAPKVPYGTGFDPAVSHGLGTGARYLTDDPLGSPLDRPLHQWQINNIKNMAIEEILIHHKHTQEIYVPHTE